MQSIRFICGRLNPAIHRSHVSTLNEIAIRTFWNTNTQKSLFPATTHIAYQCRLSHSDVVDITRRIRHKHYVYALPSQQCRQFSCSSIVLNVEKLSRPQTQQRQVQNKGTSPTTNKSEDDLNSGGNENKSLFVRFKENFKKYWYVMLPVHFVTSWMFFGGFYLLATHGLSPVPLLEYWGVPEKYVSSVKDSNFGQLAVALAFYKLATPLRYLTTLGLSGVTVRVLSKKGMLPSSAQVKALFRNKVRDIKDKNK